VVVVVHASGAPLRERRAAAACQWPPFVTTITVAFSALRPCRLPANFIAEGLDQTRGWFYTLMVLSTALFGKPAFQNLIVNGLVLAEDGASGHTPRLHAPPRLRPAPRPPALASAEPTRPSSASGGPLQARRCRSA